MIDPNKNAKQAAEKLRRNAIAKWKPTAGVFYTSSMQQAQSARAQRQLEGRLRLNAQHGRNAGHHQQRHFNQTGAILPV